MATALNSSKDEAQIKTQDVQAMGCVGRTQGDGMENVTVDKAEVKQTKCRLGDALIYHPTNLKQLSSIPPVTPNGPIINLVPKHISNVKDEKHILNSLKSKEPKFVPYEPYKAAVKPIIPHDKKSKKFHKSSLNMNVAVSQVAAMKIHEIEVPAAEVIKGMEDKSIECERLNEKKAYEIEIKKLKEENSQLENQLKFQAQVNGELKNLLVAAVGEDLETKVHLLTEDKLQLARALLNSSQHLSTHQEQTEWLAGQCEVWRSRFLASSLMVEELAKWKAALCQRTTDLQEAIKRLLEDRNHIRDISLKTYRTLSILRENFDPVGAASSKRHELPSTNITDLAQGCCQLAEILKVQLLSGVENIHLHKEINITGLDMKTLAEKMAEQLLMSPNLLMSGRQDVACSAVMGAAVALGGQIFLFESQTARKYNVALGFFFLHSSFLRSVIHNYGNQQINSSYLVEATPFQHLSPVLYPPHFSNNPQIPRVYHYFHLTTFADVLSHFDIFLSFYLIFVLSLKFRYSIENVLQFYDF